VFQEGPRLTIKLRLYGMAGVMVLILLAVVGAALVYQAQLGTAYRGALDKQGIILAAQDEARTAQVAFKVQVQEWKDILIRGGDGQALAKHRAGFDKQEQQVRTEPSLAAKEISNLIAQSNEAVQGGDATVVATVEALLRIRKQITGLAALAQEIGAASAEQSRTSDEVAWQVTAASAEAARTAASTEELTGGLGEVASAAGAMQGIAETLTRSMSGLRF
jgi:hypothetical protein